jgi:glucosamine-6-phosphate deaminase
MKIIRTKNYHAMSCKAAQIMAAAIALKPDCVLGLATGSTPIGLYEELVKQYQEGLLDFSAVKTVNLDEYRGLKPDNDQSYAYFMNHHLFQHINIDPANTNLPNGIEADSDKACADYDAVIRSLGTVDIQLLGLGNNGHIGFNEPADEFPKTTHCVDLDESTIIANARFFADIKDVPRQAYTMGIQTIMQAKKILLVANGQGKAEILYKACFGPVTPQVPASVLQLHQDVTVVADEDALSEIISRGLC